MSTGGGAFGRPPPSHHPPTRDTSTIKYVLYGPGHEKYPSWPMPAATEIPVAIRAPPTGGSQRSKSWTDHTNYPKEQVIPYTRPYMKRSNSSQPQQLKTVLEHCQKEKFYSIQYIHKMDLKKSPNGDYNSSSPPERDQQKVDPVKGGMCKTYSKESITPLTQADLEEYTKKFDETTLIQHQKQSSYAQSEGYHSYVSSSDSSTPFIDSLRRDIDASVISMSHISSWDGESTVTTRSGSVSSSETLKWHGSLSDMSEVSNSSGTSPKQLIAHSARVKTPQKQNSESVLYMAKTSTLPDRSSVQRSSKSNTLPSHRLMHQNSYPSPVTPRRTVAECIDIYEGKNIKAIQKKALLSFYERHQEQNKKDARTTQPTKKLPHHMDNKSPHNEQIVTCDSPNSVFQGPVIIGPSISLDDWVPERPPKNRQLMAPLSPENSLQTQRVPRPSLVPQQINAADSDILYKYDDPFVPSPEQDKEFRHFAARTTFECHKQTGEPQMNTSENRIGKQTSPPYKPSSGTSRKLINPYIKSTSMKYDNHHSVDHAKLHLTNHETGHKSFANVSGPFRAEPLNRRHDLNDAKSSQKVLENIKYVQSKSSSRPNYEMSGQYRAEPLHLQMDEYLDPNRSFVKAQNCNYNHGGQPPQPPPPPPPLGPKIFRSKSESHHVRDVAPHSSNTLQNSSFSKSAPHNQSMRRTVNTETLNMSTGSLSFGSLESTPMKEPRMHTTPELATSSFNSPNDNDKNLINSVIRDDRPPLPEKKKNLLTKPNEAPTPKFTNTPSAEVENVKSFIGPIKPAINEISNDAIVNCDDNDEDIAKSDKASEVAGEKSVKIDEEQPENNSNGVQNTNSLTKLQTRQLLPEELYWNTMWPILLHNLSENHPMKLAILELEEYNKTAQDIVNVFAGNVDSSQNSIADEPAPDTETECSANADDSAESSTDDLQFKIVFDKTKIEECLNSLIAAYQNQGDNIENMMKKNDEVGTTIIGDLREPHATRLNRLITEIGLITSLMCGLLSKYNRVAKSLHHPSQHENKTVLEAERGRLTEKLEDAKALKKNIENSRAKLLPVLQTELKDGIHDYNRFLHAKVKYVIHQRDLKDRLDIVKRIKGLLVQEKSTVVV